VKTHRVAIPNHRLISIDAGRITFRYKNYRSGGIAKITSLDAVEVIRRSLLHVLPARLVLIPYFVFLANRNRRTERLPRCQTGATLLSSLDQKARLPPPHSGAADARPVGQRCGPIEYLSRTRSRLFMEELLTTWSFERPRRREWAALVRFRPGTLLQAAARHTNRAFGVECQCPKGESVEEHWRRRVTLQSARNPFLPRGLRPRASIFEPTLLDDAPLCQGSCRLTSIPREFGARETADRDCLGQQCFGKGMGMSPELADVGPGGPRPGASYEGSALAT